MLPVDNSPVVYGRMSGIEKENFSAGKKGLLFANWGEFKITGCVIDFDKEAKYTDWASTDCENLCWVEAGSGLLIFNGKEYKIKKGFVFKVLPGQEPILGPDSNLTITSIQMPMSIDLIKKQNPNENFDSLIVIDPETVGLQVYEYEALGQEFITPKYNPGIGLIKFTFAIDAIPIHRHPYSGRLIRTISGKGYTYLEPKKYEMSEDTFCLFPKATIHTNGPVPGHTYTLWAVQLPWVESKIDTENIGGDKNFVQYLSMEPPKPLWKKVDDFHKMIDKLES
ncbi:hypothetical protein HY988_07040 [Candidatus Micrarchaeota archaeon]|nr:hypothetical protein [Candidatus Micrarchaeota archaeon]